jgi:CheY-like chemotaxis protein
VAKVRAIVPRPTISTIRRTVNRFLTPKAYLRIVVVPKPVGRPGTVTRAVIAPLVPQPTMGAAGMEQATKSIVICAENDPLMRDVIRSALTNAGQTVFTCSNGGEALSLARQFQARLVLLDIAMPYVNGLEACAKIRSMPGYADVPIIMLTGYTDARLRSSAQQFGANDYITKPLRLKALLKVLSRYLDISSNAQVPGEAVGGKEDSFLGSSAVRWATAHAAARGREPGASGNSETGSRLSPVAD